MSNLDIQALKKNRRKETAYLDATYTVVVSGGRSPDSEENRGDDYVADARGK